MSEEKVKQPEIFIDQDIEERYGNDLYIDYLEAKNKELKKQLQQSEEVIEEALDKVKRMEDSFKQEEHIGSARDDDCELEELRNILNKYKKEESE